MPRPPRVSAQGRAAHGAANDHIHRVGARVRGRATGDAIRIERLHGGVGAGGSEDDGRVDGEVSAGSGRAGPEGCPAGSGNGPAAADRPEVR